MLSWAHGGLLQINRSGVTSLLFHSPTPPINERLGTLRRNYLFGKKSQETTADNKECRRRNGNGIMGTFSSLTTGTRQCKVIRRVLAFLASDGGMFAFWEGR